jgi:hypothetical protein
MTKVRRTAEQQAAYYQAKANAARAKAVKQARADDTRAKIVLGAAVVKTVLRGLSSGEARNLACIRRLFHSSMTDRDWDAFEAWWRSQGHPET